MRWVLNALTFAFMLAIPDSALGQKKPKRVDCHKDLKKAVELIDERWSFKLFKPGAVDFKEAYEELAPQAKRSKTPEACAEVIARFMAKLGDEHLHRPAGHLDRSSLLQRLRRFHRRLAGDRARPRRRQQRQRRRQRLGWRPQTPSGAVISFSWTVAWRPDGQQIEAHGVVPDLRVGVRPRDWAAGRDRVLERAVKALQQGEAKPLMAKGGS